MFGYVTIYRANLSERALDRYQGYYCGLCEALAARYGLPGRMTLSFDMTFAALLLSALYEPQTQYGAGRCAPHPIKPRPRAANRYVEYAADMSIALAYYNFMDDWQDDHRRRSLRNAKQLAGHLDGIRQRSPRQCAAITEQLAELSRLEEAHSEDLDALCNSFGRLLGAVLSPEDDLWRPVLTGLGQGLGGFIYLMDAYDDTAKDRRHGSFNPLLALEDALPPEEYEQRVHGLLTQQMGICAQSFELLPILKETPEGQLLYNTIYSGVWCRYSMVKAQRAKRREGKHSHA